MSETTWAQRIRCGKVDRSHVLMTLGGYISLGGLGLTSRKHARDQGAKEHRGGQRYTLAADTKGQKTNVGKRG